MAEDSNNVPSTNSSAAETSPRTSKSEWPHPQGGWVPIGRAVFRFGIAETDVFTTSETAPTSVNPFSQALGQFRTREGASCVNLAKYEPKSPSLEDLTNLLRDKTQARAVEIDQDDGRFIFGFDVPGGGASNYSVTPWALLAMPEAPLAIDPRVEAAALFNKEGLVRISDEDAEYAAQQNRAVREATGLVWRQYMLRAFDRSVAEGGVKIFARVQSTLAPYRELPRDLWARLDVFEWQQGEARDPEGTVYHSIRAVASSAAPSAKQASVAADEEAAVKALKKELEVDRDMRVAEAISFCESQNFRVSERRIRSRVWPDARKLAGLLPLAPPGRKKSKR